MEQLYRYELGEMLGGTAKTAPGAQATGGLPSPFAAAFPVEDARSLTANFVPRVYYDWLPVDAGHVSLFVIANTRGRVKPVAGSPSSTMVEQTDEEKNQPKWSLVIHAMRAAWNAESQQWDRSDWSRQGTVVDAFHEPFQVLCNGDIYYFVTSSGKLYVAPKADPGKERPMRPVWVNRDQPVSLFIEDVDAGRTFLFCKPAKRGDRGVYFELAEKVESLHYDPQALPAAKADEPLRTALRHARFLLAAGKIQAK